jgi:hypothetical protein
MAKQRARVAAKDLLAVPLSNGHFALIWILEADAERNITFLVMEHFYVAPPSAHDVAAARPSKASSPDPLPGYDDVWKGWLRGVLPADFTVVGKRALSKIEHGYVNNVSGTMVFGTAKRLRDELLRTWRMTHEREGVEAEWAAADAARDKRASERRASMTLAKMLREPLLGGGSARGAAREAQRIFRAATKELIRLERGTKRERTAVLKRITTDLNTLDDKHGFIESEERDEIVARIEELATLVGISNDRERLTGHREW